MLSFINDICCFSSVTCHMVASNCSMAFKLFSSEFLNPSILVEFCLITSSCCWMEVLSSWIVLCCCWIVFSCCRIVFVWLDIVCCNSCSLLLLLLLLLMLLFCCWTWACTWSTCGTWYCAGSTSKSSNHPAASAASLFPPQPHPCCCSWTRSSGCCWGWAPPIISGLTFPCPCIMSGPGFIGPRIMSGFIFLAATSGCWPLFVISGGGCWIAGLDAAFKSDCSWFIWSRSAEIWFCADPNSVCKVSFSVVTSITIDLRLFNSFSNVSLEAFILFWLPSASSAACWSSICKELSRLSELDRFSQCSLFNSTCSL